MTDRFLKTLLGRPQLTDKARQALGAPDAGSHQVQIVLVPLLDVPMRDDAKDRR